MINEDKAKELMEELLPDDPEEMKTTLREFDVLMMRYDSAIREVRTKLEILNDELSLHGQHSPISSISSRRKKPMSILEKLKRYDVEVSLSSIEKNLNDVAGIRVICSFVDDIYRVARMLIQQDDIRLIQVKEAS